MPSVQTAGVVAVCGVLKLCHRRNASGISAMYTVNATHAPMTSQLQSNGVRVAAREPEGFAPRRTMASDVVVVVVVMVMPLVVPLDVARGVMMVMLMRNPRILTENERLDRHRDGEGRHTHATEIDVVEVP